MIKKKCFYYYMFFITIEFIKTVNFTINPYVNMILLIFSAICLFFHMLNNKYNIKELIFVTFILLIGGILYIVNRKDGVLLTIIAVVGLKNVNIHKLICYTLKIRLFNYISTILLSLAKIIPINIFTHTRNGIVVQRSDLGFGHPNQFYISTLIIILLYIYINFKSIKWYHKIIVLIINIIVYNITLSRTGLIIGIIMILFLLIFKHSNNLLKKITTVGTFFISIIIGIVPAIYYHVNNIFYKLDELLSWRYTFSHSYLTNYNIKLFGNNLENILGKVNGIIDCSYVSMLVNCGFIFSIMYLIIIIFTMRQAIILQADDILLIICCFSLYGITESFLPNAFTNISILFGGYYIFQNLKKIGRFDENRDNNNNR